MKNDRKQWIYILFDWLLTAAIVAAGICLMVACLRIYHSGGEQVYTPEKVAAAFAPIAVPVYICLGLIVVSFILPLVLKRTEGKTPRTKDLAMELKRLRLSRDPKQADNEKQSELRQLCRGRLALRLVCAVLCSFFFGLFLFFALVNSAFYPDAADATIYIKSLMPTFSPCIALCFGCGLLAASLQRRMDEKQIAILKQCPPLTQKPAVKKDRFAPVFRYVVLGLAVAIMVYGLVTGGWQDVLTKAVNICTECVGLG